MKKLSSNDKSVDQLLKICQDAQTLASLAHPNIIKYHDSFSDDNNFYIITDFCEVLLIKESHYWIYFLFIGRIIERIY
jgi:serine/threonine protein kinase